MLSLIQQGFMPNFYTLIMFSDVISFSFIEHIFAISMNFFHLNLIFMKADYLKAIKFHKIQIKTIQLCSKITIFAQEFFTFLAKIRYINLVLILINLTYTIKILYNKQKASMPNIYTQERILIENIFLHKSILLRSIQDYLYCKSKLNQFKLRSSSRIYINAAQSIINLLIKVESGCDLQNSSLGEFIESIRQENVVVSDWWKNDYWDNGIQIYEFQKKVFTSSVGVLIFRKEYFGYESEQFQKYLFDSEQQFKLEKICERDKENSNQQKDLYVFKTRLQDEKLNHLPTNNWSFITTKYLDLDGSISETFKSDCLVPLSSKLLLDLSIYYNLTIKFISQKYFSHLSTSRFSTATIKLVYFFTKQFVNILADKDAFKVIKQDFKKLYGCLESSQNEKLEWFFTPDSIKEATLQIKQQAYCEFGYHSRILFSALLNNKERMIQVIRLLIYFGLQSCISFKQYPNQTTCFIQNFLSWQNLQKIKQRGEFSSINIFPKYFNLFKDPQNRVQEYQKQSKNVILNENSLDAMKNILKNQDFVYLKSQWEYFKYHLNNATMNWTLYTQIEAKQIEQIFNMINLRYQKFKVNFEEMIEGQKINGRNQSSNAVYFSLYQHFLPDIKYIVTQLKKYCKQESELKKYQIINPFDKLLLNFFIVLQQKYTNVYSLCIKLGNNQTKSFPQYIYNLLAKYSYMSDWCDIFNIITLNTSNLISPTVPLPHSEFIENLQIQYLPDTSCLSCTQYLIQQTSIATNFKSKSYKLQIFPKASKIRQSARLIAQVVCMMLNSSTGGVILFDCVKCYGGFIPYGEKITEKDKEGLENQIKEIIASLYPKPTFGGETIVSFVPIVLHPLKNIERKREFLNYTEEVKDKQQYLSPTYLEGKYVMRIKVVSKNNGIVYLWMSEEDKNGGFQYCSYAEEAKKFMGSKKPIKTQSQQNNQFSFSSKYINTKIHKIIKLKLKQHQQTKQNIFKYTNSLLPLSHTCKVPFPGKPISSKDLSQNDQTPKFPANLEKQYNHMSVVVLKFCFIVELQQSLRESGIKFQLQRGFEALKLGKNAIIIYHDENFSRLLGIVQDTPNLYFNNKRVITLYVAKYVNLEDMTQRTVFNAQQWENINKWLQTCLPDATIKFFQFTAGGLKQYYIEGSTKLATLCVYFILNEHKMKTSLKNPQKIDRMTEEQKNRVFVEKVFDKK